jgi:hypothetical protein
MLGIYQIVGCISSESLLETFKDDLTTLQNIRTYRSFLEDAIEQNYNAGCSMSIQEYGPLQFDVIGEAKKDISVEALLLFEKSCRIDFVRRNATNTTAIR